MSTAIPSVTLSSGHAMPVVGMGTAGHPPPSSETFRSAIRDALSLGYRQFDTASLYGDEQKLGDALAGALREGLVGSRDELFVTTKLWCDDAHRDRVVPSLKESLRKLQLDYVDLYLIHWPLSLVPHDFKSSVGKEKLFPMDLKAVWEAMEECQALGLTKSIGVSNFSCKKLEQLLGMSKIPPAVNQVEMHPVWQQKKLMDFCKARGVQVCAYSPLGASGTPWGTNQVIDCDVLKEIAVSRGKSVAQISLRWIYEQGAMIVVKSYKRERMKENIDIIDWELSQEDLHKISQIKQSKGIKERSLSTKMVPSGLWKKYGTARSNEVV